MSQTKEKSYSRKNLIGKIARRIYELNENGNWNFILSKNNYCLYEGTKHIWIDNYSELTVDNLAHTLFELNRINKFMKGGKQ